MSRSEAAWTAASQVRDGSSPPVCSAERYVISIATRPEPSSLRPLPNAMNPWPVIPSRVPPGDLFLWHLLLFFCIWVRREMNPAQLIKPRSPWKPGIPVPLQSGVCTEVIVDTQEDAALSMMVRGTPPDRVLPPAERKQREVGTIPIALAAGRS